MDRSLDKVIDQPLLPWLPLPTTQSSLSDVAQLYLYDISSFELDWKTMRHLPWRFFYLDYLHLQQDIGSIPFTTLNRRLENEWTKVYDFFIVKKGEIERRLACCEQGDMKTILSIMNEIHYLHRFAKLNYIAFLRLVVESDKLGATVNDDTLSRTMMKKPFWDDMNVLYSLVNRINTLSVFTIEPLLFKHRQESSISINPSKQSFFSAVENFSTALSVTTAQAFSPVFTTNSPVDFYQPHHHEAINKNEIKGEPETMHYSKLPPPPPLHHPLSPTASISTLGSCETASSSMGNTTLSDIPVASRSVRKYWVHPDHIMEVMLYLSHHAVLLNKSTNPSFTYPAVNEIGHPLGIKSKLAAMSPLGLHRQIATHPQTGVDSSTQVKITTLHMDTPDLKSYAERIVGQPLNNDASNNNNNNNDCFMTRARWYETDDHAPFVALEQKAYHQHSAHHRRSMGHKGLGKVPQYSQENLFYKNKPKTLGSSYWVQQRLWLKSKRLWPWIRSRYSCKRIFSKSSCQYRINEQLIGDQQDQESMKYNLMEIEKEIHQQEKIPMLKTTQNRIVYGTPNNKIFITVDTDISMMKCSSVDNKKINNNDDDSISNESTTGYNTPNSGFINDIKYPYSSMPANGIVRFPYCVIQISEETVPSTPSSSDLDKYCNNHWIDDLCESPLLEPVHDFSAYLHGVATLLSEKVHVFPSWMSKIETMDIRKFSHGSLLAEKKNNGGHERGISNDQSVSSITTQSSLSKSEFNTPWSSTTIATLVTYCEDDDDDEENFDDHNTLNRDHSITQDNLLSPRLPLSNEHRRSFDSYCSFDHPTSSKSDPTNCKSCVGKKKDMSSYDPSASKLLSVVRTLWPNRFIPEREPLFHRSPMMNYHSTSCEDIESAFGMRNDTPDAANGVPRATLLTSVCIIISLGLSLLFYTCVINI